MRRVLVVACALFLLAGCGEGASGVNVDVGWIERPDGGRVECATADMGGIDCNWDGAR